VSGSEPLASQDEEPKHAEEVQETEQRPDVHGPAEAITMVKSRKTSEWGAASSIIEDPTFILVG